MAVEHVGGARDHASHRGHAGLLVLLAFAGQTQHLAEFTQAEAGEHAGGEGGVGVAA
ncbi:MAG: hypothetical protein HQL97_10700 [Magnetococcales bacterium]|nr:hypothetical protein [Magnetococcales bacterium]